MVKERAGIVPGYGIPNLKQFTNRVHLMLPNYIYYLASMTLDFVRRGARPVKKASISSSGSRISPPQRCTPDYQTVNCQLAEQLHIETNHVHAFGGLCTRLYAKLIAHTLCSNINRQREKPDFLQVKALTVTI